MVRLCHVDEDPFLIVTHPFADKFLAAVLSVLAFLVLAVSSDRVARQFDAVAVFILVVFGGILVTSLRVLLLRVVVRRREIRTMVVRTTTTPIPVGAGLEVKGRYVTIRHPNHGFEYSFSKYLDHRGQLVFLLGHLFPSLDVPVAHGHGCQD